VLSHSRKAYGEATFRQTSEDFLRALENALWHFGGVPKTLVVDNLKAAVLPPDGAPGALPGLSHPAAAAFVAMVEGTPALRAAWLELHDRLAKVARDELAAQAGVDPRDPEPTAAGRALAGLADTDQRA